MKIELINPETQAKLRKPVLIGTGIIIVLGVGWLIFHKVTTPELTSNEFYDRTSGTVVDTYGGSPSNGDSPNIIYGIESIEDALPDQIYSKIETLSEQFVTYAYPNDQFSYQKDSLKQVEDYYIFEIIASKQKLTLRFASTEDQLAWLEILSGDSVVYTYGKD